VQTSTWTLDHTTTPLTSHSLKFGAQRQGTVWQGKPPQDHFKGKWVQSQAEMTCPQPGS
jgi:hypothetical protein